MSTPLVVLVGTLIGIAAGIPVLAAIHYGARAVRWLIGRRRWLDRDDRDAYALWLRWADTPDAERHRRRTSPDQQWLDVWPDGEL